MLEELRKYRNAMPFVPFTVFFRDGRQLHVADTYHMAFGGRKLVVVYQESSDAFQRIDSEAVIQIEADIPTAAS